MTRLWIGVGLLLILLLGGIALWLGISPFHNRLAETLDQASLLAVEGNWAQARSAAFSARDQWLQYKDSFAAVTDHEPMEQMDALFRELSLLDADRAVDFSCVCVQLAGVCRAIGETQSLKWWGIL